MHDTLFLRKVTLLYDRDSRWNGEYCGFRGLVLNLFASIGDHRDRSQGLRIDRLPDRLRGLQDTRTPKLIQTGHSKEAGNAGGIPRSPVAQFVSERQKGKLMTVIDS
jgi:hypothetical protein